MAGFIVSILIYPFAVWGLRRFFTERLEMENNIGFLVFLLASVVSWVAAEASASERPQRPGCAQPGSRPGLFE